MDVHDRRVIDCFVTPKQLRRIADDMENEYEASVVGDKIRKYTIGSTDDLELRIMIDQERIEEPDM